MFKISNELPNSTNISLPLLLACECHALGSARDDCEQTSGRCACRYGVRGDKCDTCSESMIFAQDGTCLHGMYYTNSANNPLKNILNSYKWEKIFERRFDMVLNTG